MPIRFEGGGGMQSYKVKVLPALPATGSEGEIVVISGVSAPKVVLSVDNPLLTAPATLPVNGVWIETREKNIARPQIIIGKKVQAVSNIASAKQRIGDSLVVRDAYIRKTNIWVHVPYEDAIFANNSWAQIASASEKNLFPSTWMVGDTKDIVLSTGEVLTTQIYGFRHDDRSDGGGKAGITLGLKNLMADIRPIDPINDNTGGITRSPLHQWLQSDLYNSLPPDLRAAVKMINKKTSAGGGSSTIDTNAIKIFLFSEVECFGTTIKSVVGEGAKYSIFTDNTSRIKKQLNGNGAVNWWWGRSPIANYKYGHCAVGSDGGANFNGSDILAGICFGLSI